MVNFTCNKCGDSLKKKEVSAHFMRRADCGAAASVTCFDCLKVFGNDYVNHTICITETQRYSANGLSGIEKTKQQVWTEAAHEYLSKVLKEQKSTLSHGTINCIEATLKNPSIPKKERAFLNFIENLKKFDQKDALTVWRFLEEVLKSLNEANRKAQPVNGKNTPIGNKCADSEGKLKGGKDKPVKGKISESSAEKSDEAEEVLGAVEEGKKKKKKKKKKKSKKDKSTQPSNDIDKSTVSEHLIESRIDDSTGSEELIESRSPKRKRENSESMDVSMTNEDVEMQVVDENTTKVESKKERKLKKKREKYEAEMRALETEEADKEQQVGEGENVALEEKKKKNKKSQGEEEDNEESGTKKKNKRQRTVSMAAESDQPKKKNKNKENDENAEPNEELQEQEASFRQKAFNWGDVIIQVLSAQDNKEMSVKRLCKKVVNEYLSSLLEGTHVDEVKVTAKFQKKLNKTPGVFVHKDKARLKTSD